MFHRNRLVTLVALAAAMFVVADTSAYAAAKKAKQVQKPPQSTSCLQTPGTAREGSRFVRFTAPNGCDAWINAAQIIAAHPPTRMESQPRKGASALASTQIRLPFGLFFVKESPAEVADKMPEKRRLTLVNGGDLFVNPDEVFVVFPAVNGITTAPGMTGIRVHEAEYFVRETPWEVAAILEKTDEAEPHHH